MKKSKFFFLILCTLQLFYIFHSRSGFQYEVIKNPFDKYSGVTYALSPEIIELKYILNKNNNKDFNLSKKLKEDNYFYQRSIEFNYPVKLNQDSKLTFYTINDEISNNCELLEKGKYLKLAQCIYDN